MNKIFSIIRHEFITTVTRRSYILMLVLLPAAGFILTNISSLLAERGSQEPSAYDLPTSTKILPAGIIDSSGLISKIPESFSQDFQMLGDETSAIKALQEQKISAFFIIPAEYLQTGQVIEVQPQINLLGEDSAQQKFNALMTAALSGFDDTLYNRIESPLTITLRQLQPAAQTTPPTSMWVPYIVMIFFYITILGSSSLLLSGITTEKQNRIIEVLLSSITPVELLTGKIIALGAAGLLQTLVWAGSGMTVLRLAGSQFNLGPGFSFPPEILLWAGVFYILGYALYGSLMAGLGAMAPNLREATQSTILIIFPLIIPMMFSTSVAAAPNAPVFLFMSIFPFTAPITMLSRISATQVPLWQIALSISLLAATCVLVITAISRLFRAQTLLAGNPFKASAFIKALVSRD